MRLLVISDIHLECGPFTLPEPMPDFDVAVFAGDIGKPISEAIRWMAEQRAGPLAGRPAIYVPGNHEFYNAEMKSSLAKGRVAAEASGIDLLSRDTVVIGGVRFIGCVLWTDYRLYGTVRSPAMLAPLGAVIALKVSPPVIGRG